MGARALFIEVRWPDGRFHGVREGRERGRAVEAVVAEWPPSPFRLFQALVAGAYGGRWVAEDRADKDAAFTWLERLDPPAVSAPRPSGLRAVTYFVPNNDLDAKGGDPAQVANIRTSKTLRTSLFDADRPVAYLWTFDGDEAPAKRLADMAGRLHTLGHGIDAAFAHAEVLDAAEAEARLVRLGSIPRRPSLLGASGGAGVPCPTRGSLESLIRRHQSFAGRFERFGAGRKTATQFRQPLKPHTRAVAYDRAPRRMLFELKPLEGRARFRSWPLAGVANLTVAVRDQAERALKSAWPGEVQRLVTGRSAGPADIDLRLRILPLPSIGMRHTDPDIRRVLIEVPPDHPIPIGDLEWALAGRELVDANGEFLGVVLTPSADIAMLKQYGVSVDIHPVAARVWRTVTPAALPEMGGRSGGARASSEVTAANAVAQGLRHAGVTTPVTDVRVQREPFDLKGERSDRFEPNRFKSRDLRHIELIFAHPVAGPMAIGDGRWLGLGLMRPVPERVVKTRAGTAGLHVFVVRAGGVLRSADSEAITRALRRAVMARAQAVAGTRIRRGENLPSFFTGHVESAAPERATDKAREELHEHLFYGLDPGGGARPPRLLVIAPHHGDRNAAVYGRTRRRLDWLSEAVVGLTDLRAGRLGRFDLAGAEISADDHLFAAGKVWTSVTPYQPTRHPRPHQDARNAIVEDVLLELERRRLPRPTVDVLSFDEGSRGGLSARIRLYFAVAVAGPILIGKGSHFGRGLFAAS